MENMISNYNSTAEMYEMGTFKPNSVIFNWQNLKQKSLINALLAFFVRIFLIHETQSKRMVVWLANN